MKILIWILQVVLAAMFLFVGTTKAFQPVAELHAKMPWSQGIPVWIPRLAGFAEIVGAIGVVLPSISRIKPILSPMAATGLGLVMVLAAIFHLSRGEFSSIIPNLVLLALAAFVGYARWKMHPIPHR